MPVGLLPDRVAMPDIMRLMNRIVDASHGDQSPRKHRENLVRDQGVAVMRFMLDERIVYNHPVSSRSWKFRRSLNNIELTEGHFELSNSQYCTLDS